MKGLNIFQEEEHAMGLDGLGRLRQSNGKVKPMKAVNLDYVRQRYGKPTGEQGQNGDLYHYQTYGTAGLTAPMSFFQAIPANLEVGNLKDAGKLPANLDFLVKGISVDFVPAGNGGVVVAYKDFIKVMNSGVLKFEVEGQIEFVAYQFKTMPMENAFEMFSTDLAANVAPASIGRVTGSLLEFEAPILLKANASFSVELSQPAGAVTVTSDGKIGVRLRGTPIKHRA